MRDQVREALFSILGSQEAVSGRRVLDLFAGSGSLGLEALSRGAAEALFVDRAPPCLAAQRANIAHLGWEARARVRRHDLAQGLAPLGREGPFGLVLVHPPFELLRFPLKPGALDVAALLQELVSLPGFLEPEARIVFETPRATWRDEGDLPWLDVLLRRRYGSTALFVTRPRV